MGVEEITAAVAYILDGSLGVDLKTAGYQFAILEDLGEIYLKNTSGDIFCLLVQPKTAEECEGWGVEWE